MSETIFTKIVKGTIPSYKIYEDQKTLAFLDIHPIQPGHVLVIPKKQIESVWDLTDEDYLALMKTVKLIAAKLKTEFKDKKIGIQVEGLDVPHAHIKIFPFSSSSEFHNIPSLNNQPDTKSLSDMAQKLII